MNGNCHFMFGASVSACACLHMHSDLPLTVLAVSTCLIGSIFPDIDNPDSSFGHMTKPVSTVIGKVSEAFGKTGSNHRGLFHDFALHLASFVLSCLFCPSLMFFFLGTLSHLFLDMFNPSGIPVLFVTKCRIGRIRSGDTPSVVLTVILASIVLAIGIVYGLIIR